MDAVGKTMDAEKFLLIKNMANSSEVSLSCLCSVLLLRLQYVTMIFGIVNSMINGFLVLMRKSWYRQQVRGVALCMETMKELS